MRWYNDFVVRVSHSAWLFLMSALFAFGSLFFVFMNINVTFEAKVGAPMFDFQNSLTVAEIFAQLPNYDETTFALYHAFLFVDYYFPFFAGVTMAAAGAFAVRHLSRSRYDAIRARSLFALFLVPTLFDWGENTFALTLVNAWPDPLQWAATGLVWCKKGKLATVVASQALVGLLLAAAALKWAAARVGLVD